MNTDLIIIGGGISGCALAYYLACEGLEVILLEKSGLNGESSGANSGSLHGQIPHEVFIEKGIEWANNFGPTLRLLKDSIHIWRDLERELGTDLEVRVNGGLLVAKNKHEIEDIRSKAKIEKRFGINSEFLDKSEIRKFAPYLSEDVLGAMYYPEEGKANPLLVTPAFASKSEKLGTKIYRNAEVKLISIERKGFVVNSIQGTFKCKRIVNCAGNKFNHINSMVGITKKIFSSPIQSNVTEPVKPLIKHLLYSAGDRLTLKQTVHGSLIIGGGWPSLIDKKTKHLNISFESLLKNLSVATDIVPSLESIKILRTWPAMVNGTDDWIPIIGQSKSIRGYYVLSFPWMGFTGGPISAKVLANEISNGSAKLPFV